MDDTDNTDPYKDPWRQGIIRYADWLVRDAAAWVDQDSISKLEKDMVADKSKELLFHIDYLIKFIDSIGNDTIESSILYSMSKALQAAGVLENIGKGNVFASRRLKAKNKLQTAPAREKRNNINKREKIEIVRRRAAEFWAKKPSYNGNAKGTATFIVEDVMNDWRSIGLRATSPGRAIDDIRKALPRVEGWIPSKPKGGNTEQ